MKPFTIVGLAVVIAAGIAAPPAAAQNTIFDIPAPPGSQFFGSAVGVAGDVDGDGRADVIVGDWFFGTSPSVQGRAQVFSGAGGALLLTITGTSFGDTLGRSVGPAGDLDHDGYADLLIGSPMYFCDCANNGKVRVYSGKTGAPLFSIFGSNNMGWSSALAGDVNADGDPDYIVGSPASYFFSLTQGSATVFSGKTGLGLFSTVGAANGAFLGLAVAGVGDVDGDGIPDWAAGAPQMFPNVFPGGAGPGSVRVLSGANGSLLFEIFGTAGDDFFGAALAAAGDANQDGFADILIGAPGVDAAGFAAGRVVLLSGAGGTLLHRWDGAAAGDQLGTSVAGLGDVDLDGFPDFALGAPHSAAGGADSGSVRVISGKLGSTLMTFVGPAPGAQIGTSLGAGGDADGDTFPDAILGGTTGVAGVIGAQVVSFVPTGIDFYGIGTPGCVGPQHLSAASQPFVGNASFRLTGDRAPASALGLGLVATAADLAGSDPFGLGALLHIDPLASSQLLGFDFTSDAAGYASAPAPIPQIPQLQGSVWYAQALWAWGAACSLPPFGLSSSWGLQITIQ
jgi:hypothetical protein